MASELPLQISFHTDLIKGGYGRINGQPIYPGCDGNCMSGNCDMVEEVDNSCGYFYDNPVWEDVSASGEREHMYYWRDSNVSADYGLNSRSSRGYVKVKDVWNAKADDQNNIIVTHDMYVTAWGRDDLRGSIVGTPGRGLAFYRATNGRYETIYNAGEKPINQAYSEVGNVHIGTFIYTIPPQTSSRGQYPNTGTLIRNWTGDRYGSPDPYDQGAEQYADMMYMGADFKNNLPNQFLPPVLSRVDQEPDICEDFVTVTFEFEAPIMSGAALEFMYWYNGETEADATTIFFPANAGIPISFDITPVFPSRNHDVFIHWKARFMAISSTLKDSDWVSGSEEIVFIPPPNMTVPDISAAECAAIVRGELIPPYEEIVSYGVNG